MCPIVPGTPVNLRLTSIECDALGIAWDLPIVDPQCAYESVELITALNRDHESGMYIL